jgi:hypothetical protein
LAVATTLENAAVLHRVPVVPVLFTLFEDTKMPLRLPVALIEKSAVVLFVFDREEAASSAHVTRFDSV